MSTTNSLVAKGLNEAALQTVKNANKLMSPQIVNSLLNRNKLMNNARKSIGSFNSTKIGFSLNQLNANKSAAEVLVKSANTTMTNAKIANNAMIAARAASNAVISMKVNTNMNGKQAASTVVKVTGSVGNNFSGVEPVLNAAKLAASKTSVTTDPLVAAINVAKAAKNAAKGVEVKMVKNSMNATVKAGNQIANMNKAPTNVGLVVKKIEQNVSKIAKLGPSGTNSRFTTYAAAKPGKSTNIITAAGNTKPYNTKRKNSLFTPTKRPIIPFTKGKLMKTQVYKQGEVRSMYKNKNGIYTKSPGLSGNAKNYLYSTMNSGLFGNKMM